jgi:O-antigen/teichoic acid export membrane protein
VSDPTPSSSIRRDVVSAYAATAAKIGSWVIVSGLVFRQLSEASFAMLALVRGTIGILTYTTLGLSPAMIRMLAEARRWRERAIATADAEQDPTRVLYANGLLIALMCGVLGVAATLVYAAGFNRIYDVPLLVREQMFWVVLWLGFGTVLRLMSDAPGSVLQSHGRIAEDNWLLVEAESLWVLLSLGFLLRPGAHALGGVALCYALSGVVLLGRRTWEARRITQQLLPRRALIDLRAARRLLAFGSLVLFGQLADYLYAPMDYILINRLLGWEDVVTYTPAMTIDSGMLLLVSGLSSVILPRAALAHSAGERERVRRYYVYGTLASAFLLMFTGAVVYLASPLIFRLWLGNPMWATQAILPLVLIHTIVGGSSAVGRSILLGMGQVRAFTISVLIAGVANVLLSYIFVRHLHLGLKGIIYGTLVVVVARAGIWMPWYVLRALRKA